MLLPRLPLVAAVVAAATLGSACGASLPARYVVERDIGEQRFRRYQRVMDVEIPVQGNDATGHTATYLQSRRGHAMTVTTAFVSVYRRPASLAAEIGDALRTLETYDLDVVEVEGDHVWRLRGGDAEQWLVWVSANHVVKLGAPQGADVPEEVAEAYLDLYPSDLDEHGRAEEGAPSAGASRRQREEQGEGNLDLPEHLREGAPR